eukprot:Phypoly_transcript_04179.p1 GENE.Phypoly_transcript_04179~~Phypoly_transcript_04179.p1  ORF type:complete len:467 (+),score=81.11 Phypoly_transcript_04179:799-2199(+)
MKSLLSYLFVVLVILCGTHGADLRPFIRRSTKNTELKKINENVLLFNQLVDHFDSANTNTWAQRYTVNTTFYTTGGPTFIFLAGEAPMEFFGFQEVQALKWAAEFGANYISLEHRFYGYSIPTKDFSTPNLKYLTSQQALADAANFITSIQKTNGENFQGKWVVFGCSYSGALSAWFRAKYPDLVVASVAPSGPVEALLNFTGYYGQFSESASPDCVSAAAKATNEVSQLMQSTTGRETLAKYFNACDHTIAEEDSYYFLYSITDALGSADQMNNPPDWGLNATCNTLTSSDDYVQNWGTIFIQESGPTCTDFRESTFIRQTQDPSIKASQDGNRAWTWQTCVEFGFFSSSYPGTSVFFPTLDVEHQVKWCEQIYGIKGMTPNITYTNSYYGGKNVTGGTNIMFTNGDLDPWHLLSINEDFANGDVLAATYEAGHCGSMIEATSVDPPSLTAARTRVTQFLSNILQ